MSRAYIVTRNGGTVTKAPINGNKIPIYANKTAMEADASNIPDGSIVFTKSDHDDVIDQMKEYIRNQNVLSDWEQSAFTTTNTPARFDGELTFYNNGTMISVYVNDVLIAGAGDYYNGIRIQSSATISFKKGDNIRLSMAITSQYARYYKLRDYSDR